MSRAAATALALLGGVSGLALAQDEPGTVARAVLVADSAGDWVTLLRLAHPDALRQFRSFQVLQLRLLGDTAGPPGQAADSSDSTQHREFAERRVQAQRAILDSVYHVRDVETLARLAPDSVAARWLRASRTRIDSSAAAPVPRARYVGLVRVDDTLAYAVVVRTVPRPAGPVPEPLRDVVQQEERPEVMVLRRLATGWRSMLDGTTLSNAAMAEDPLADD
ncbi:MAG: hypothetical protein ACJ8DJ_13350 [Gemmatimonadales bacterium]